MGDLCLLPGRVGRDPRVTDRHLRVLVEHGTLTSLADPEVGRGGWRRVAGEAEALALADLVQWGYLRWDGEGGGGWEVLLDDPADGVGGS